MKLTLFILLFYSSFAFSQSRKKHPKAVKKMTFEQMEKLHKDSDDDCIFTNKYPLQQRLKQYPFSKSIKVLAVSYPLFEPRETDSSTNPVTGLHVKNGILNYSSLKEVKQLNAAQIDSLTNILFNTDFRRKLYFNGIRMGACFDPRNALIFIDNTGKVFDYLEICFACKEVASKSEKIDAGVLCTQKYELLRTYFQNLGLTYGTKKSDDQNAEH